MKQRSNKMYKNIGIGILLLLWGSSVAGTSLTLNGVVEFNDETGKGDSLALSLFVLETLDEDVSYSREYMIYENAVSLKLRKEIGETISIRGKVYTDSFDRQVIEIEDYKVLELHKEDELEDREDTTDTYYEE